MYKYIEDVYKLLDEFSKTDSVSNNPQFYIPKVKKFFEEFMNNEDLFSRPMDDITSYEINKFLEMDVVKNNKLNYYYALKKFFDFTYIKNITRDVMKNVEVPEKQINDIEYLSKKEIKLIKEYCESDNENITDKLLVAFFMYTGLSRKYIAKLEIGSIYTDEYKSYIQFNDYENVIPMSPVLSKLYKQYIRSLKLPKPKEKIFKINDDYFSTKVSNITKKIVGRSVSPTIFSNTFIKEALEASNNNVVLVSKLVMESPTTIAKHLNDKDMSEEDIFIKQATILNQIYK
jgi:site-specific recombinase XerD